MGSLSSVQNNLDGRIHVLGNEFHGCQIVAQSSRLEEFVKDKAR